eukprot:12171415-Alexandrium_andersonii.AAC.1
MCTNSDTNNARIHCIAPPNPLVKVSPRHEQSSTRGPRSQWNRQEVGDPQDTLLDARGAALRVAPPASEAVEWEVSRRLPVPSRGEGRLARWACWDRGPSGWICAAGIC